MPEQSLADEIALVTAGSHRLGREMVPAFAATGADVYELPALPRLTAAGRIRPEAAFTRRFPMSDGANAYRMFADRADGVSNVVLDPRT
ncbi:hypothetical protein ACW2Q0_28890 [Nocardia sp. R16R-3T]